MSDKKTRMVCEGCGLHGTATYDSERGDVLSVIRAIRDHHETLAAKYAPLCHFDVDRVRVRNDAAMTVYDWKSFGAKDRDREERIKAMTRLRAQVAQLMVMTHRIPRELADRYVAEMDDAEIERRLRMYGRQGVNICPVCFKETPCCDCDYAWAGVCGEARSSQSTLARSDAQGANQADVEGVRKWS